MTLFSKSRSPASGRMDTMSRFPAHARRTFEKGRHAWRRALDRGGDDDHHRRRRSDPQRSRRPDREWAAFGSRDRIGAGHAVSLPPTHGTVNPSHETPPHPDPPRPRHFDREAAGGGCEGIGGGHGGRITRARGRVDARQAVAVSDYRRPPTPPSLAAAAGGSRRGGVRGSSDRGKTCRQFTAGVCPNECQTPRHAAAGQSESGVASGFGAGGLT